MEEKSETKRKHDPFEVYNQDIRLSFQQILPSEEGVRNGSPEPPSPAIEELIPAPASQHSSRSVMAVNRNPIDSILDASKKWAE